MYVPVLGDKKKSGYVPVLGNQVPIKSSIDFNAINLRPASKPFTSGISNTTPQTSKTGTGKVIQDIGYGLDLISGATVSIPSRISSLLSGDKQEPIQTLTESNTQGFRELGANEKTASLLGVGLSVIGDPLNLISGGGSGATKLAKLLAKTDDIVVASRLYREAGFAEDIVKSRAPELAIEKDANKIYKIIESDAKLQSTTKVAPLDSLGKRILNETPSQQVTKTEDVALRDRIRQQATGAKAGFESGVVYGGSKEFPRGMEAGLAIGTKAGKAEGVLEGVAKTTTRYETELARLKLVTENVVQTLKNKALDVAAVKQIITDYAKSKLDLDLRGRLLSAVNSATTKGDVAKAIFRINKLRNEEIKAEVVSNVEKLIEKIDALPPNQQKKAMELVGQLTTESFSKTTQAKLEALKEFLTKEPDALFKFGAKTIKKTERAAELGKQKLSDTPARELFKINDRLEHLMEEGQLAKKTSDEIKGLRIDNALKAIKEGGTRNLDEGLPPPRKPGEPESTLSFAGARDSTIEGMRKGVQYYVSPDVGFQILDNDVWRGANWRVFKRPIDAATDLGNEMRNEIVDNLFAKVAEIEAKFGKLTTENYENVMLYATLKQVGGRAKLQLSDARLFTDEFLDGVKLSEGEMEFYKKGREIFDGLRPHIERVLYATRGEKLGKVDNYWSWITDFDNSDELFQRLSGDFKNTSRTEQGFTKSRTMMGSQKLNLNALDVLVKHINDSSDFIHKEELLNHLGKIARSEQYANSVGKMGQKWVAGWIDLISRGGVPKGYRPGWATLLVRNIGHGVLGFRISPIVKQPLAMIVSTGFLGKHTRHIPELLLSPSLRESVQHISAQQRFRNFDDPTYIALAKAKKLAQWQKWGYQGIKTFDSYTADSVWYSAYRKSLDDRGVGFSFSAEEFNAGKNIDTEATEYADLIVRRTQGSSEYKDAPLMYAAESNRDLVMAFLQFQRFVHNQSILWRDAKVALTKEKDPVKAAGIASALIAAGIAESYVSTGVSQIFSSEDVAKKAREKSIGARVFNVVTGQIPVISNLTSMVEYGGTGVPVWDVAKQGFEGAVSVATAKKTETKLKGATRAAEAVGSLSGISGSGQVAQILRKFIPEAPSSNASGGKVDASVLKKYGIDVPSKADILKKYNINTPSSAILEKYK